MKIVITGGAGFIASHVADKYIDLGHEVIIIDNLSTGKPENLNPKAKFYQTDITSSEITEIFKNERFDIINHHAAQMDVRVSVKDPLFDANTNIIGAINLFEAAKNTGVRKIIFASSGGTVYGDQLFFPADEIHPTNPCSPYGIAKLTTEKYLFYYHSVWGMDYAALRYANIYGPRQNPHGEAGVVAIFTQKMLKGEEPIINGDGKNTRDYVFIQDVVKANVLALNPKMIGAFNIGTAVESDVNFIFRTIKDLTGSECPEVHGEAKAGEQFRSVLSFEKINQKFGWVPEVDFYNGLVQTVDWFKNK